MVQSRKETDLNFLDWVMGWTANPESMWPGWSCDDHVPRWPCDPDNTSRFELQLIQYCSWYWLQLIQYCKCIAMSYWEWPFQFLIRAQSEYIRDCINSSQRFVNGTVKIMIFKGSCRVVARSSETSLYNAQVWFIPYESEWIIQGKCDL